MGICRSNKEGSEKRVSFCGALILCVVTTVLSCVILISAPLCFFKYVKKLGVFEPYQDIHYFQSNNQNSHKHKEFKRLKNRRDVSFCDKKEAVHISFNSSDSLPVKELLFYSPVKVESTKGYINILPERVYIEKYKTTTQVMSLVFMSAIVILIILTMCWLLIWVLRCAVVLSSYSSLFNSKLLNDNENGEIIANFNNQIAQLIPTINKILLIGWQYTATKDNSTIKNNNKYE